jgi:hypothetical protein
MTTWKKELGLCDLRFSAVLGKILVFRDMMLHLLLVVEGCCLKGNIQQVQY